MLNDYCFLIIIIVGIVPARLIRPTYYFFTSVRKSARWAAGAQIRPVVVAALVYGVRDIWVSLNFWFCRLFALIVLILAPRRGHFPAGGGKWYVE